MSDSKRRLAAIMFTDIVGYTALMSRDEGLALELLDRNREILKPIIEGANGEWLKEIGDGSLSAFASAVEAVQCAVEIQRSLADDQDLTLRIGIHIGDVVFRGGDVFGDGVNVASRIEPLAEPGGICVSERVYADIRNQSGLRTGHLGRKDLKGIAEPVDVYTVLTTASQAQDDSGADRTVPAIAVLPFVDMSPDKDQEYFCDGMTEELIDALARVDHLKVVARTSAFAFKNKQQDIRLIGNQLGVDKVLEGSIRKSGNQLRITVQLINVSDGFHLWSEKYDRELEDVFAIQDEIALTVVSALKINLGGEQQLVTQSTDNIEAYDYYLRGREFFHRANLESLQFAIGMFTRAIEIDPEFARAYAGLADCHSWSYLYFGAAESKVEAAIEASGKALELGPNLAEAHVSHGWAASLHGQYDLAESEFDTAIGMNDKLYEAYYLYARTCWAQGKMERTAQLFEKAAEVNPQDFQALSLVVAVYDKLGDTVQMESARRRAIKIIERRLELNPDDIRALDLGAALLIGQGERERGLEFAERALAIDPDNLTTVYNVACCYARAGDTEKALDYLSKVLLAGFSNRGWVENDGDLTSLHGHPRFQELLDQMDSPK
ncbi:MAG: tetratricopeptide repeat protein [Candidatus Marinimicrobia bacterium]|nr:tetratricopeptide repeat protein [Candidatus Neomarinimicrobiota bacterium]